MGYGGQVAEEKSRKFKEYQRMKKDSLLKINLESHFVQHNTNIRIKRRNKLLQTKT